MPKLVLDTWFALAKLIFERVERVTVMANPSTPTHEVTQLLIDWSEGNTAALKKLMPLVYRELRHLARQYLNRERDGHALQTTDLVHEAYLKIVDQRRVQWQNRTHFFGVAAELMRRILVDHARHQRRAKRGGGAPHVSLAQANKVSRQTTVDLVALDEALSRLATVDERKARIVELRFFGGLEVKETAEFLKISTATVMRDWNMAKAWLHRELSDE
ncbi:MAG: sigma-70 family RNA polymerase sigma factor [Acidobacteriota bacterium]|nr:sigma-70 family RNA polymerase sigma factor [Acidobacteriota bacterium]